MAITFSVQPGYQFTDSERVTYSKLNLLGNPGIVLAGTVDSSEIQDGAVTTQKLASSIDINSKTDDHNLALTKLAAGTHGQLLYYNASGDLVTLPPGTDGYFLKTKGADNDPEWSAQAGVSSINISQIATDGADKFITTDSTGVIQWETKNTPTSFGGVAVMWDQKITNTPGGASTGSDQVRDLNQFTDPSLILANFDASTGTWDLDAGSYLIESQAPAADTGNYLSWIENTTDSTVAINGTSAHSGTSKNTETQWTFASGIVTIADTKTFALKFRASNGRGTYGLGRLANITGHPEVYSIVKVTKIA